ncbi:MAG: cytochrome C oxidase subunit IV family protein [Chitinophagales bacterium]|nr:cytochrome C oxidase subunit IV family protein [Chitinophagales bacterium]
MSNEHGTELNMVKLIWRTFWIMLVVTVVEIICAVSLTGHVPQIILNIFYVLMSGVKAFYIVAVFMHLRFEIKYLAVTILIPMTFLFFAVLTLLAEGYSWNIMRHY